MHLEPGTLQRGNTSLKIICGIFLLQKPSPNWWTMPIHMAILTANRTSRLTAKGPYLPKIGGKMRSKFHCSLGVTNVWREPPLNGAERMKIGPRSVHLNQKPIRLLELIIEASSDVNDVIWEPFGGLCTSALAAFNLKRKCYSAEIDRDFFELAVRRLQYA